MISKEFQGEPRSNWLLTAYEKEKPTATDRTTDIGDTELQNDTAPLQTESSSTDKDSDSSRNNSELGEKIADAEANRVPFSVPRAVRPMALRWTARFTLTRRVLAYLKNPYITSQLHTD